MKFSLEWLLSHLDTDLSASEIAERLVALGIEVEEIIDSSKKFEKFVLGQILKKEKHPDADKLSLCEVTIGLEKPLQIVCGAHNVREGMKVAVALEGAVIPASGFPLKRGKIRGIESQGMMSSSRELEIDLDDEGGIVDLTSVFLPVGSPLAEALGALDIVFDVSITPNRSDCFSVRGIARALEAAGVGSLKPLAVEKVQETEDQTVNVEIKTPDCPYFSCRVVKGVSAKTETPDFIKRRLSAVGQKLIYAPVDIANYICLDLGQPMHIFDLDKISSLIIRNSIKEEKIDTLDGNKEVILPEGTVVVASPTEALSIAGIMGGSSSSFGDETKNILIESACFNKVAIALAGQKLRILSDSRTRNERGVDPNLAQEAMDYASSLLAKICPCRFGKINSAGKLPDNRREIQLSFGKFQNLTGWEKNEWEQVPLILEKLGLDVKEQNSQKIKVITPTFRYDLNIEEDLIEEVMIAIGYDNVDPLDLPLVPPVVLEASEDKLSDILIYNGIHEVITFSFVDEKTALLFSQEGKLIRLEEPLTKEFSTMQPSVICSLLKSFKNNQNKSQPNCAFFEKGKQFSLTEQGEIKEEAMLTVLLTGVNHERSWQGEQKEVSVFDAKRLIEKMLAALGINNYRISAEGAPAYYHPGRKGAYTIRKNDTAAFFGEIHPRILKELEIKGRVVVAELFLDSLPANPSSKVRRPVALSPFHPVTRDFSFVVSKEVSAKEVINSIKKAPITSLNRVNIFDVYEMGDDKKAIGVEVTLSSLKGNMTDEQILEISENIIAVVKKNCKAELRK